MIIWDFVRSFHSSLHSIEQMRFQFIFRGALRAISNIIASKTIAPLDKLFPKKFTQKHPRKSKRLNFGKFIKRPMQTFGKMVPQGRMRAGIIGLFLAMHGTVFTVCMSTSSSYFLLKLSFIYSFKLLGLYNTAVLIPRRGECSRKCNPNILKGVVRKGQ